MLLLLRFLRFLTFFFKIQKVVTFYVFLPCFVRFLELCSATGVPIHFMFGSRVGFSGTADQMALFSIRLKFKMAPPSWIISNGHISATPHDLLV